MKKLFLLLLSMVIHTMAWCAVGSTFTSLTDEGITMKFQVISEENKTCCVYGNNIDPDYGAALAIDPLTEGVVTIPASVNGYTVTSIGSYAFLKCTVITSVVIPEGVQYIFKGAFQGCSGMSSMTIPSSVVKISEKAFYNCTGLQSMTIEEGVTTIGTDAFSYCTSLEAVSLPNSVKTIEPNAFWHCTALASIDVPSSVEEMCRNSFEETAWYNNQSDGLVYIGDWLLGYKGNIPDDAQLVVREGTKKIATLAFYYKTGRRHSVLLPNSVTKIGDRAFYQSFLASITLSKNLTTIGQNAFARSGLTHVVIPESVTSIPLYAFEGCSSLTSVTMGSNVSSIDIAAFEGCSKLTTITVGTSTPPVLTLHPFYDVSNKATLQVPKGSKSAYEAADHWKDFKTITELPANYASNLSITTSAGGQLSSWIPVEYDRIINLTIWGLINANDFATLSQLTNLETLNVAADITDGIPARAFQNHQHLESVSFTGKDSNLYGTRIGDYAFDGCSSLTSYSGLVASLGDFCFRNTNIGPVTLCAPNYYEYDSDEADWFGPYNNTSNREFSHIGKNPLFGVSNSYYLTRVDNISYELSNYYSGPWQGERHLLSSNEETLYALGATSYYSNSSVTTVAAYAVSGNPKLEEFYMGNICTVDDAFLYQCSKLKKISCPTGNTTFAVVDDVLYSKNIKTLVKYPCAKTAEELTIPSTVEQISKWAFEGTQALNTITMETTTPPTLAEGAFDDFDVTAITLKVPYGSKNAYMAANGWKNFNIVEILPDEVSIAVNYLGKGTYCSEYPLDFTNVSGIKAYIISGFNPDNGKLILTRAYEIPAGTGLYIDGTPSTTFSIPVKATAFYYSNMLKGVLTSSTIATYEGGYTNYVLVPYGSNGVIFAHANDASLSANRAYVQIPTSVAGARSRLGIEIDDNTTGIEGVLTPDTEEAEGDYYNLNGQKVQNLKRGIYIRNGKKIIIH